MKRGILRGLIVALLLCAAGCHKPAPPPPAVKQPEAAQPATVSVFFPNKELKYLQAEARDVLSVAEPVAAASEAVKALLEGPEEPEHVRVIPKGVKLNKVSLAGGTAIVDLSGEFSKGFKGGSNVAELAVYSVVNTVASVPHIDKVQITIDGKTEADFAGAVKIGEPLALNPAVIGGEKLNP